MRRSRSYRRLQLLLTSAAASTMTMMFVLLLLHLCHCSQPNLRSHLSLFHVFLIKIETKLCAQGRTCIDKPECGFPCSLPKCGGFPRRFLKDFHVKYKWFECVTAADNMHFFPCRMFENAGKTVWNSAGFSNWTKT